MRLKRILCMALCLLMLASLLPVAAGAEEQAKDISGVKLVAASSGCDSVSRLFDGYRTDASNLKQGASLTLHHGEGIGSLYILFGWECGAYTVTDEASGECREFGGKGILHEFLDLEEAFGTAPETVTVRFENSGASIMELYAYTAGEVPDTVQKWEAPAEGEADLVLFSTHGDDEQLFFAGMIPYYAAELGYKVQVVYMTDHRNVTLRRVGEMLDGLWAVGLRTYPVFGDFPDFMTENREDTWKKFKAKDVEEEDVLEFVVENIRRFRPKVAVGHDLNGEYGHGMHMVYADALCEAVETAGDAAQFPESAEKYGVWDVPKTYLHLYEENPIVMDWDRPLESFDGMTAYEVTKKLGFPCHGSQQVYYRWYFTGHDTAADIPQYSPREFGLYRSTVGMDEGKNDFFENVTTHGADLAAEAVPEETAPETEPAETIPDETEAPVQEVPAPVLEEERDWRLASAIGGGAAALVLLGAWAEALRRKKEK